MPSPSNLTVARQWRAEVISTRQWKPHANQAGLKAGEAGGYRVEADGFDRLCYLKPANPHADEATHCRAAREKIASDLAYDLGLEVPPVQLTTREAAPAGCRRFVCVGLIQYPKQWSWQEIKGTVVQETPSGVAFAAAMARCSPLLAFDTWTDQKDHNDHPDNVVWGYDPAHLAQSAIIFLDYSNAMGFDRTWNGNGWQNVVRPPWLASVKGHLDSDAGIGGAAPDAEESDCARGSGRDPRRSCDRAA